MHVGSLRWGRALLMALVCAALFSIDIEYQARFFGIEFEGSLAHLHTAFLLAVAMLTRDPLPLRACVVANLLMWLLTVAGQDATLNDYLYGVLAMAATYVIVRATARLLRWPRHRERRRFELGDVPRIALIGTIAMPLAFVLLAAVLDSALPSSPHQNLDSFANALVQVFFAKHFGVSILTMPLLVYVTHATAGSLALPWWRASVPWRLLLIGVLVPAALIWSSARGWIDLGETLARLLDYRLLVAALLIWCSLRLDVRWTMALLALVQLLFTAGMAHYAAATTELPGIVDLLLAALEILVLEALVLLLYLSNRDRDESLAQRERDSRREPLTGLPNLNALRALMDGDGGRHELAYLLLDRTDRLASSLGLKAESALMRKVAATLRDSAESYYIGSGQLVLVERPLVGATSHWDALLARLHALEFRWAGRSVRVLPYLGVAASGTQPEAVDALILRASSAAFEARERGESHVLHALEGDAAHAPERRSHELQLSSIVLSRLRAGEIELWFQPIVPLGEVASPGAISGEILCRLRDATGALMPPSSFIPEIQADRRMVELDLAVLRALGSWLREHGEQLRPIAKISVNVGGQSLASSDFAQSVLEVLSAFPIPLSALCFEVTETAAITHLAEAGDLFACLRALGCQIAIDDFGIGFQSFERLKQIPVDLIKIDGTFVREMLHSERDHELVRAAVAIARAFDAQTVAEYVEDEATANALRSLGVDWGQGYLYGKPAPLAEMLLADHQR